MSADRQVIWKSPADRQCENILHTCISKQIKILIGRLYTVRDRESKYLLTNNAKQPYAHGIVVFALVFQSHLHCKVFTEILHTSQFFKKPPRQKPPRQKATKTKSHQDKKPSRQKASKTKSHQEKKPPRQKATKTKSHQD